MKKLILSSFLLLAAAVSGAEAKIAVNLESTPGVDFKSLALKGTVAIAKVDELAATSVEIAVVGSDGLSHSAATLAWSGFTSYPVDTVVEGLAAGDNYSVEILVKNGEEVVASDRGSFVQTARKFDGKWIDEDADTFAWVAPGTGRWDYRKVPSADAEVDELPACGKTVKINAWEGSSVYFEPTNDSPAVANSSVRKVTFQLYSEMAGYSTSMGDTPDVQRKDIAGVTIACDDEHGKRMRFAVLDPEDRSWVLTETDALTNTLYSFTVVISYPNPGKASPGSVAYYLEKSDGTREQVAVIEPRSGITDVSAASATRVRISGCGYVKSLEGECYDAHLVQSGSSEYWSITEALKNGGTGKIVTPLWPCTYSADISKGRFGVRDPNNWLNLTWPLGYVVQVTESGDVRYYDFLLSDFWTDWAVADDVVATAGGWEVKTANGLAWLARESAERTIEGEIKLADDITNLNEHVWRPIRAFSGTFDGNNKTLAGLTNKGQEVCSTNELPMTAYGLFGTATDSVFRNVAFADVAISNSADAVGSLLGCSLGGLKLNNVAVGSGSVEGCGRYVAGIVGYVGEFSDVEVSGNSNLATVAAPAATEGGVNVAGIANLGSNAGDGGKVKVSANENGGALVTTVDNAVGGGNVAQILAGSDPEAKFAEVQVTGNVGTGDVSRVTCLNHAGSAIKALPIVNLGAEVSRQSTEYDYREFVEANDATDAVIDPYRKTARSLAGFYQNGVTNFAGRINDMITAAKPGDVIKLEESGETWTPVELDRAIVLDLDGKIIDNVFDGYTFAVAADAGGAVVRNGTVTYPEGKLATRPKGDQWSMQDVTEASWACEYWERTLFIDGDFVDAVSLPMMAKMLSAGSQISAPEDSAYSIDAENEMLNIDGKPFVPFAALGFRVIDNGDGSYVVELAEEAETAPELNLALAPNGGTSKVVVKGAKVGVEYCLQSVETLSEAWDKPTDKWVSVSKDGEVLEFEVDTSKPSGFYRIKTKVK